MTLHSDTENEYEDIQDAIQIQKESTTIEEIIFDNGLSSLDQFDPVEKNSSRCSQNSMGTESLSTPVSHNDWRNLETSGDGQTTTDDEGTTDPIVMFYQESDRDHANSSGDEDLEIDYNNEDAIQQFGMNNNALGSYLLAPMGFDDDDDDGPGTSPAVSGYVEAAERFQMFAGVKEFDESDQIGLENRAYEVVPKMICKTLSNMGIIDEEYLEEMSAVRSSYQRAFRSLVLSALTSIKKEQMILESRSIMAPPSTPTDGQRHRASRSNDLHSTSAFSDSFSSQGIISASNHLHTPPVDNPNFPATTAMMRTLSFGDMFDNDPTRYKHDFVEICKLGKGGFASVFKARNKLDGIEYAIKKIRLRGGAKLRYEKIFREIKFLARLDHKNVIRYYSSWLEHADYPVSRREMYGSGGFDTNGDMDEYDDEYGDEDEYTNTMTMTMRDDEVSNMNSPRRSSLDYFSPHSEQHSTYPEDLSMGIVFGDEYSDDCGVDFESMPGLNDSVDSEVSFQDTGKNSSYRSVEDSHEGEEMERTHSVSSTLTSRNIPGAANKLSQKQKHKSPTVSQEMQGRVPAWECTEDDLRNKRSSLSNSYSALSTSIEEIQRSLPSSSSGFGLGSRYGHSQTGDHDFDLLGNKFDLQPFPFLHRKGPNGKDFVGGGIGGLHGVGSSGGDRSPRSPRSSTGKVITRDLTLFIQMQLCQTTLQDYLVYRNERPVPVTRKPHDQLLRKHSKTGHSNLLAVPANSTEPSTHSTPGSPLQQTYRKELVDQAANQHIFRAIVEGVAYIHDQDMIHRDLKPSNIFLGVAPGIEQLRAQQQARQEQDSFESDFSLLPGVTSSGLVGNFSSIGGATDMNSPPQSRLTKEQEQEELFMNIEAMIPKIGDFGLVTDQEGGANMNNDEPQEQETSEKPRMLRQCSTATSASRSSRTRTTAVGTVTYASPEQLARPNLGYDQKADIYSLGIIFFELYHPFSTLMERHAVLRTLRNGELPPEFVSRWPKEAAFVLWLMAEDPRMRPTAREILEFDLIRKVKEETMTDNMHIENEGGSTIPKLYSEDSSHRHNENLLGLGLSTKDTVSSSNGEKDIDSSIQRVSSHTGKPICEACQARCRCSSETSSSVLNAPGVDNGHESQIKFEKVGGGANGTSSSHTKHKDSSKRHLSSSNHSRGHRSSKSISQKLSRSELEHKLTEETEKSKRLEMSLAAMRAEQKALLDRLQILEYEKELSWKAGVDDSVLTVPTDHGDQEGI
ncbi:hypothetical protein FBU30_000082 [Linnemannia zychae]|nr:hypothetical protein FBU30_000082 [Linnemannia zychae]